ncbi:MAG TPA: lipocalin family protein [Gammaproteobacteria bacterium]
MLPARGRPGPRAGVLLSLALLVLLSAGCTALPEGLEPVRGFELERYLGRWYEIARLDHRFERGLSRVTADYGRRDDGGIRVLNRGYDAAAGSWKEAEGKAYFLGAGDVGSLKVSFFGPFYGGYHVLALDPEYRWALVAGPSRDYLWILAREPELDPAVRDALVGQAARAGFPVQGLISVAH